MAEPEEIVEILKQFFAPGLLTGKRALVTAGPTYEAIDPVRFIGNHSTGKMGFAIAEELAQLGAQVTIVSGPTNVKPQFPGIDIVSVVSAEEMYQACISRFAATDITVLSAAVADYKPSKPADQKIKKTDQVLTIELTTTKDIAAELGKLKTTGQIIVGFALETQNEKTNAEKKLISKNFDLIVLNSLQDPGAGFGHDTNKITLITSSKQVKEFNLKSKKEVARDIVKAIIEHAHA
jgi:phosphopantothenoylcysteine decarboxylase / phosphopantothenate---cysteine ligase